jgi:hypothetical protein
VHDILEIVAEFLEVLDRLFVSPFADVGEEL